MYLVFNGYLNTLRATEELKPPNERRQIPTVKDLAESIGIHEVTLHNIVNGKIKLLNIQVTNSILSEMWRRGFKPQLSDFIKFDPPEG